MDFLFVFTSNHISTGCVQQQGHIRHKRSVAISKEKLRSMSPLDRPGCKAEAVRKRLIKIVKIQTYRCHVPDVNRFYIYIYIFYNAIFADYTNPHACLFN